MQRPLLIAAVLMLAGILAWLQWSRDPIPETGKQRQTLDLAEQPKGGDFRLASATGPLDLTRRRGQVVLVYFGYTWCPDVCPTNLAFIADALKRLTPGELDRVEVLFVSVDPQRDDSQRLAEYTGYFHPRIRGLTGPAEQVAEVARRYGAAHRRAEQTGSAIGYMVDHSSFTYVVDPQGRLVRSLDHATPPEWIVAAIRSILVHG